MAQKIKFSVAMLCLSYWTIVSAAATWSIIDAATIASISSILLLWLQNTYLLLGFLAYQTTASSGKWDNYLCIIQNNLQTEMFKHLLNFDINATINQFFRSFFSLILIQQHVYVNLNQKNFISSFTNSKPCKSCGIVTRQRILNQRLRSLSNS